MKSRPTTWWAHGERALGALPGWLETGLVCLTVGTLLLVVLAQTGQFHRPGLLLVAALVVGSGYGWHRTRAGEPAPTRVGGALLLLGLLGVLLLGSRPAEHFALSGDAAIYPNTASLLARTGHWSQIYTPLSPLTAPQRQNFYLPAAQQKSFPMDDYQGLLFNAYYVTDAEALMVIPSRQPLFSAWLAAWQLLGGLATMAYAIPVFGICSLLLVFLLGERMWHWRVGALAALWLALSFPQLYFTRAPYAEACGQCFTLVAFYAWINYAQQARPRYLLWGAAACAAACATRLDSLVILGAYGLLGIELALRRDRTGLRWHCVGLYGCLLFTGWTLNRPYADATLQVLMRTPLPGLPWGALLAGLAGGCTVLWLACWGRADRAVVRLWWPRLRRSCGWLLLGGFLYALGVRPWRPEYWWQGATLVRSYNEELLLKTLPYVGLVIPALSVWGVWREWRHPTPPARAGRWLLPLFVVGCSVLFLIRYTTARYYPVALRRLAPEVLPGWYLLGAAALWAVRRHARRLVTGSAAAVALALMCLAAPFWVRREGGGTLSLLTELQTAVPASAITLFEPLDQNPMAGWLAAPFWSLYGRPAVLLNNTAARTPLTFQGALCAWQQAHSPIYVVSQTPPEEWWPGEFRGELVTALPWHSSLIGPQPTPAGLPYLWEFEVTFMVYRYTGNTCF